jgi:hypothetical protein
MSTRPARRIIPTSKLTADNAGDLELSSHRRAVASASAALTVRSPSPFLPESSSPPPTDTDDNLSQARSSSKRPSQAIRSSLSLDSVIVVSPTTSDDGGDHALSSEPKTKKAKKSAISGDDSQVSIIDIDDIDNPNTELLNKSSPTADIKEFFSLAPRQPGQPKRRMKCNICE